NDRALFARPRGPARGGRRRRRTIRASPATVRSGRRLRRPPPVRRRPTGASPRTGRWVQRPRIPPGTTATVAPRCALPKSTSISSVCCRSGSRAAESGKLRRQRCDGGKLLLGVQLLRAGEKVRLRLRIVRIHNTAVDRADGRASLLVVEADAFGTEGGIDDIDVLTLRDGLVRTLGLAGSAVDALLGDDRRHSGLRHSRLRHPGTPRAGRPINRSRPSSYS